LRILIVDDHEIVRRGVRRLLEEHWEICGEAENGKIAVEKVRQLKPDAVVLDVSMPIMSGYQAAQEIRRISPSTKIVFLTMHDGFAMTSMVQTCKADGFVTKSETAERLVSVLKQLLGAPIG
jgi:DNA-binding NarL/FixJ family response regulator